MKKQLKITRYIGLLFFLFVYFVSPPPVSAVACTGLPSIGDLSLSSCTLTVAGTTGADQASNIEESTTNTANLSISTGTSVTINSTGTLAVGSITVQGGSIAIDNGGQIILNTPLYISDADADGWASNFSTVYTATSSGRRRLSLMRSIETADCGDSTYSTGNVCCTVATRYQDADGDSYGNPSVSISACTTAGYVDNASDCYDGNANAYPSSTVCSATNRGDGSFDYNCSSSNTTCGSTYYLSYSFQANGQCCGKTGTSCCSDCAVTCTGISTQAGCGVAGYLAGGGHSCNEGACGGASYTQISTPGTQSCQ